MRRPFMIPALLALLVSACDRRSDVGTAEDKALTFNEDVKFLEAHATVSVLSCPVTSTRVAVVPQLLGAVMTSCPSLENGDSFGFVGYNAIERDSSLQSENPNSVNVPHDDGGIDLLELVNGRPKGSSSGPGQMVVRPTPASKGSAAGEETRFQFEADGEISGDPAFPRPFHLERVVQILNKGTVATILGTPVSSTIRSVAVRTSNLLRNTGKQPWDAERGWVGLRLRGSVKPAGGQILVVPVPEASRPPQLAPGSGDSCSYRDGTAFLKSSGSLDAGNDLFESRADHLVGLYDATRGILTFVQIKPATAAGVEFDHADRLPPPVPIAPGETIEQTRTTIHFEGGRSELDQIARQVLGVSLAEIETAFSKDGGVSRR
jgi:hypothetical protein